MKKNLLKNFLQEHFSFDDLKKVGFYDKTISRTDYEKQAERICKYFGIATVYEYNVRPSSAHITFSENKRPNNEPFVTHVIPWHETSL